MNRKRYIAYRLAWTVFGAWGVLTSIFFAFTLTPDPDQYCMGSGCREMYRAMRNYDEPVLDRYLTWMENFLTLDLGTTIHDEPVVDVLAEAATVTLTYLVLSIVFAVVIGVAVGLFLALRPDSRLLRVVRSSSYVGFSIPAIVAAFALFILATRHLGIHTLNYDRQQSLYTTRNLVALTLPAGVVTVKLLAVQLRYARSEATDILQEDFVRALHANGADTVTLARHVLKNAASSLLSLFFSELVGVMFVVVVIVEVVFGVPGFGQLLYEGIQDRDPGIILTTTTFPILLILFGNLLQDVAYSFIDPRIDSEAS